LTLGQDFCPRLRAPPIRLVVLRPPPRWPISAGITDLLKEVIAASQKTLRSLVSTWVMLRWPHHTTRGMQQVEDLMFSSLDNGHAMPTLTAYLSFAERGGKRLRPMACCWPRRSPLQRILPASRREEFTANVIRAGAVDDDPPRLSLSRRCDG
ncbi:MAG: hypothetical protein U1U88_000822, partial [Lawsonella clevelandensis]